MSSAGKRAAIEAYIGATGSGKGLAINRRLDELKPRRLLIWDPCGEYGARAGAVNNLPAAVEAFKRAGGGPVRVRYVPGGRLKIADAFGLLCDLAFTAGDLVFVGEELSDVTTASWAPPSWRRCNTQGRHRGLHIIGATQRPALIDKTILSGATRIRCGALEYSADIKAMADHLRRPVEEVAAIRMQQDPHPVLDYIERDKSKQETWRGRYTIKAGRVVEKRELLGST